MKKINEFKINDNTLILSPELLESLCDCILNTDGDKWYIGENFFEVALEYNTDNLNRYDIWNYLVNIVKYLNDNKFDWNYDVYRLVGDIYDIKNLNGYKNR